VYILYSIVLYALTPFVVLNLLLRSLRAPAYRQRIKERFGYSDIQPRAGGIWLHAVSVGESIAAIKLVRALQQRYPDLDITFTCGTPTGSAVIRKQLGDSVHHCYLAYDLPGAVRRFLSRCQPSVGIIMETEIWPNILREANRQGVWLMLSNMRLSETSYRRYQWVSNLVRSSLRQFNIIAAQTGADAERVLLLGAHPETVRVVGNLKFELDHDELGGGTANAGLKSRIAGERMVWVAGSTHSGEDQPVLDAHRALLERNPDILLIIVPRHPERFTAVYDLCQAANFSVQKRSELADGVGLSATTQVLLLDTMGELNQYIAIADWAFIGGSLVPVGGHNVLEACQAGVPVLFGPHMQNFKQVANIVEQQAAGERVSDARSFVLVLKNLSINAGLRKKMGQQGRALIAANSGALESTLDFLAAHLSSDK